ncbi:hypothetical protein Tco_1185311 [Tanacetum coccineum]
MESERYLLNYLGSGSRFDMAYPRDWIRRIGGFLGVRTTFDIFQNIHILYLEYGVLTSSGYGVLSFIPMVFDMKKDPETPLLVGRGFLATASAVIDCRKAKIAVGEGINRSVFRVKEIDLGEEVPYWTTLGRRESYGEDLVWMDILVFRKMVEFLGTIPINLKRNMWESKELVENPINWDRPPKEGDGAWHIRIELIDPDGVKFKKTFQSIPVSRKLSPKENPSEIIDLDHFHDS